MNPNVFPKMEVVANPFKKIGAAVTWLFTAHQLSDQSDHFQYDSLATPIVPVTVLPDNKALFAAAEERMQAYWSGWEKERTL